MYQSIKPPDYLKKYIDCFWIGDDLDLNGNPNFHHAIASSKFELLFFCSGIYATKDNSGNLQNVHHSAFYGQTTDFDYYFTSAKRTVIFGIRFLPLASLTLLNIPATELTNQKIDLNSIVGNAGIELTERIIESETFEEKTRIASIFFKSRLKMLDSKYLSVENVLLKIHQVKPNSIPDLVLDSYLSPRQFERHFKDLTGFSARTYLKVKRFEQFIENMEIFQEVSEKKWIDLALNLGYYDQAHLNRHFKEFTGLNPTTYFKNMATQM